MQRLQFDYRMKIEFSEAVSAGHFTLKCFPMADARQRVLSCETRLEPETAFSQGCDSFGNPQIYGAIRQPHTAFSVRVTGAVELLQTAYEAEAKENEVFLYRNPHGMNRAGSTIRAYHEALRPALRGSALERAAELMHRLHRDFSYETASTDANTPAETAFAQGRGVCQDYAHIFISLCHLEKIPARYVAGLLIGEGESHAWVEVLEQDKWIGLDVTNDIFVTDSHIKFGHGRDAADCRMNTGIVYGSARQTQHVAAVAALTEQ